MAELAAFGSHDAGIDRPLATPQERAARERFAAWAARGGYALSQDAVGNVFARRAGATPGSPVILTGSHLDTVPTGGAYDGAYGVVAALCALEILDARGIGVRSAVEAVAWAGEEGGRFPMGCLGSAVFAGITPADVALALRDAEGTSLREALASPAGGLLDGIPARPPSKVAAYLELHVEQGPVLEAAGKRLGVVTAIAGQRRLTVRVRGTSGHAGTVPMRGRSDPLAAAAEIVLVLERAARDAGDAVATVGRMIVEPGGTNVIPATVTFSVDIRSPDEAILDRIRRALDESAEAARTVRGVRIEIEPHESRPAMPMDSAMREAVKRAVASLGETAIDLPSGAGHDAMCVATVAPAAMLFVPSIGGASHVGEERTAEADLELGVEALVAAIAEVDRSLHAEAKR